MLIGTTLLGKAVSRVSGRGAPSKAPNNWGCAMCINYNNISVQIDIIEHLNYSEKKHPKTDIKTYKIFIKDCALYYHQLLKTHF